MDADGYVPIWSNLSATFESICKSDPCYFEQREARVHRPSEEGLSRSGYNAGGNKAVHCQDRARDWKNGDQKPPSGNQTFGEGQKASRRGGRSTQGTQIPMDGPPGEGDQDVGTATRRLPQTSGYSYRVSRQGKAGSHCNESYYPTIEQRDRRRFTTPSTTAERGGRSARGASGQRGGRDAKASPRHPSKLRQLIGIGDRHKEAYRSSGCRNRGRRGTAHQAAKVFGTVWVLLQAVTNGRVNEVQRNSLHEAFCVQPVGPSVEAYLMSSESFGAASDWSGYLPGCLLPWKHSVTAEKRYTSPFQASLNALNLQWEVGSDLLRSQFAPAIHEQLAAANRIPVPSQRSHPKLGRVRFEDHIDVFLGEDDAIEMSCLRVAQGVIANWPEKPWSKKRVRSKNRLTTTSLAPLSRVAVLSRDVDFDSEIASFVQTIQSKHDTHNENDANLIAAFVEGQTGTDRLIATNQVEDIDAPASPSDAESSSAISSGIRPPSSTGERQEVIMFHVHDPPLRAFLDWSSYDNMIREIAGHYATVVENVVDAYEINADLKGIPDEAVPIIVHLFPDIAVAHAARLALFDVEYHAHNSEPAFRLGPRAQRFVLPVPEQVDRDAILTLAHADVYCRRERDRCFVWHGNERWQDTDVRSRQTAHGDYFRVAIPPTERFVCTTQRIVEWAQNGLPDEEIIQILNEHELTEGYSPSMLNEDELRQLATTNIEPEEEDPDLSSAFQVPIDIAQTPQRLPLSDITNTIYNDSNWTVKPRFVGSEHDSLSAMQLPPGDEASTPKSSNSSGNRHLQDWKLDLIRVVQQHIRSCTENQTGAFAGFSVYTWFLDHQSQPACFQPRIILLGEDPADWEPDLVHRWRHHVNPDEPLFFDVVSPFTPRADVEGHIAHILLSQRAGALRSTLVSLEFTAPTARSVIVRCALAVPNPCSRQDIDALFPLFAGIANERLVWQYPELFQTHSHAEIHNGMGIMIQVLPEPDTQQEEAHQDTNSLLQPAAGIMASQSTLGVLEPRCSFTDEFLEAISAAEEAMRMEPPALPSSHDIIMSNLPEAFHILLDRFAEEVIPSVPQMPRTRRIESWFLDHVSSFRCHSSRISLLHEDVTTWRHAILETWRDKVSNSEQIEFHVVDPNTEDAATGIIGQILVTQRASPALRSTVMSVYDSDADTERSPYTFAVVLQQRINLERVLDALHLASDCPPLNRQNHCSLWFGRLPIDGALVVSVRMGQSFRLVIGRGIAIDVAQLLQMDDGMLRDTLQRSAATEIFIRPNEPDFLHLDNEALPSRLPFVIPDGRPGWIPVLQQHFDRFHVRDSLDEGPYLLVSVWHLNAHPQYHCGAPRLARLSEDPLIWRAELMTSWRDQLIRASPADFFVLPGVLTGISTGPQERTSIDSQEVHVLLHQALSIDMHVVLITLRGVPSLQVLHRRFAHVLRAREPVQAILRLAVPAEHAHRPAIVQHDGCTYLASEQILLHTGSHLVVEISSHELDLQQEQITDDTSLFQHIVTCKPADFQEPDDFPVSLPTSHLPRRPRPRHDGEFEWSLQFGHLLQQHGDIDPWTDTLSIEVTTWYVDHLHSPVCHQARNLRMSGHAVTWIEDLRNLWADRLDQSREFSIHLVQPRPPHFRVQRVMCHILLEQGRTPGHEALVLTALLEGFTNEGIIQGAFSVASRTHMSDIIRTMEIAHFCVRRRCAVIRHPQVFTDDQWFDVASGQSLRLRIEPLEERPDDFDIDAVPFEDLSLMQTSDCFHFNPQAVPFVPGQMSIASQSEEIQDLYAVWERAVSSTIETPRKAVFLTWFVSPGTGISRCRFSRKVTLFEDFLQWHDVFRQTWQDLIDPEASIDIVLVQPAPTPLETGVAGHVILIQYPLDIMSTLLVTVRDVAIHEGRPCRIVVTVPENAAKRDLLQSIGYERDCHLEGASCQIRHALAVWEAQRLWPIRDGDCFYVQVMRAFLPASWQPPLIFRDSLIDSTSLLQVQSQVSKRQSQESIRPDRPHRKNKQILLVVWYVDQTRPICRAPRTKLVCESACLIKQAEKLWEDLCNHVSCRIFAVETMARSSSADHECDEVGFVIDGRTVDRTVEKEPAVVLERVLHSNSKQLAEHFATFVSLPCCPKQVWNRMLGRPGNPSHAAAICYMQGREWHLDSTAHSLAPGCCISFWLEQTTLANQHVRVAFREVVLAFEWLDAHFFLPCYDLPVAIPMLPVCQDWIKDWWGPDEGGTQISVYFDGSFLQTNGVKKAGAAVAAFVCVQGRWKFAGALATALPHAKTSYQAELSASIIATKFAYDILKLIGTVQDTTQTDVYFCYDSLTTGKQTSGEWQAVSSPISGHLLRSLHKLMQKRFRNKLNYNHVKAHCGEPGNELVDTLAHQAALERRFMTWHIGWNMFPPDPLWRMRNGFGFFSVMM